MPPRPPAARHTSFWFAMALLASPTLEYAISKATVVDSSPRCTRPRIRWRAKALPSLEERLMISFRPPQFGRRLGATAAPDSEC